MRVATYFFAALLVAGCAGRATVPPTDIYSNTQPRSIVPMDQQFGGSTFREVVITGIRSGTGIRSLSRDSALSRMFAAPTDENEISEYAISADQIRQLPIGTLTPSTVIVDSNHNLDFTATNGTNKIFRLTFGVTQNVLSSCSLPQSANNGIAQLPDGNFAVGDIGNHINIVRWPLTQPCQVDRRFVNPDIGAIIHDVTADSLNNVYFADSRQFARFSSTGTFQLVYKPTMQFTPREIRYSFGRLVYTASSLSGPSGLVGDINGGVRRQFAVPFLAANPYAADEDNRGDIWYARGYDALGAISPSGVSVTLTDPHVPTTFQVDNLAVGIDGQVYFASEKSAVMDIYNHILMKENPTSLTITLGTQKSFTIGEILQPFPGTVPTTFSAQSANNAIAKVTGVVQSNGQATVTVKGIAVGTTVIYVKDVLPNSTIEPIAVSH